MINVNDLRTGTFFKDENQLWQVVVYEHIKMGRGSGNIKVKVKNLKTGSLTEKSFITGAKVEEADVEKKKAQFLYVDGESYFFMDPVSYEQFPLSKDVVGEQAKYLKDGLEVNLIVSEDMALGMEMPNTLVYEIVDTGPGEKGNTVGSVFKDSTMDNGLQAKVPIFMKVGDKIKIDTRSGEYVERVK